MISGAPGSVVSTCKAAQILLSIVRQAAIFVRLVDPARRLEQQEGRRGLNLVDAADVADQEVERAGPPGERLVDRGGAREARLVAVGADDPPLAQEQARDPRLALAQQDPALALHLQHGQHARQPQLIERAAQRRERPVAGRWFDLGRLGRRRRIGPTRVFTFPPPRAVTTARSKSSIRNGLRSR